MKSMVQMRLLVLRHKVILSGLSCLMGGKPFSFFFFHSNRHAWNNHRLFGYDLIYGLVRAAHYIIWIICFVFNAAAYYFRRGSVFGC